MRQIADIEKTAICTVCSLAYLPQALTMVQSLRRFGGDLTFHVYLSDLDESFDGVIRAIDPETNFHFINQFADCSILENTLRLTELEYNTSLKAVAVCDLFEMGFENVLFCDSDLYFLGLPTLALEALKLHPLVLTPHQEKITDAYSDLQMCRYGVFNSGFIGFSGCVGVAAANWLKDRTLDYCVVEPEEGLFVDQKWLDLAPALFNDVYIIRDPSYNVAYWNIERRGISNEIIFLHLSGISLNSQFSVGMPFSKYSDLRVDSNLLRMLGDYRDKYLVISEKIRTLVGSRQPYISRIFKERPSTAARRYQRMGWVLEYKTGFLLRKRRPGEVPRKIEYFRMRSVLYQYFQLVGGTLCRLGLAPFLDGLIRVFSILGRRSTWLK